MGHDRRVCFCSEDDDIMRRLEDEELLERIDGVDWELTKAALAARLRDRLERWVVVVAVVVAALAKSRDRALLSGIMFMVLIVIVGCCRCRCAQPQL